MSAGLSDGRRAAPGQQRRVGLIGGMSWRSTALYYERLNRTVEARLGAHRSFAGVVWNLDYAELFAQAMAGDWAGIEATLVAAARGLADAGCSVVALTAVTAHRWHDAVAASGTCSVPHVLDAAARALDAMGVGKAGVLGTGLTCASDFVRRRLGGRGRELLFLDAGDQAQIDALIQDILTAGDDRTAGRALLGRAAARLKARGAETVVLACTELPLLLPVSDIDVPLIDGVALHVDDICDHMLSDHHVR
jgi:aspartate racemase